MVGHLQSYSIAVLYQNSFLNIIYLFYFNNILHTLYILLPTEIGLRGTSLGARKFLLNLFTEPTGPDVPPELYNKA
jgi:hypothetical protein